MIPRCYRLQLYRDRTGGHRWRLVAPNGQTMATGEAHPERSKARRAWRAIERAILGRTIRVVAA